MHFPAQIELIQDEMCYVAFMIPSTLAEAVTSYRQTDTNLRILFYFIFFTVTGLSLWGSILSVGIIVTFYTSMVCILNTRHFHTKIFPCIFRIKPLIFKPFL